MSEIQKIFPLVGRAGEMEYKLQIEFTTNVNNTN